MGRYSRVFAFESVPHYLAGGLRGFPLEELAVELGGTLGMSDAPFTGVTATPPWDDLGRGELHLGSTSKGDRARDKD